VKGLDTHVQSARNVGRVVGASPMRSVDPNVCVNMVGLVTMLCMMMDLMQTKRI